MAKKRSSKKQTTNSGSSNIPNTKNGIAFRAKLTVTDKKMNRSHHNLHFRVDRNAEMGLIKVYPDHLKQHVDGFGAAFTDAAGYVYSQMNPASQERFLKMCFSEKDHNYRLCRAPIQSNDFSRSIWSYVTDEDDEALETFSLGKDTQYLIPLIKDALGQSDDIKIISSPWSPPSFMKTNHMVRLGGHLKKEYYTRWADVIVRYILAYRKRGIHISALTVQNEPNARQPWESCEMSPEEESNFAINYLKPALVTTGLTDVKIFVWDHNKEQLLERVETELSTDGASTAIDGVAFHWYSGDHFEALREATSEFPNKLFYMTEGCEALPRNANSDLEYAEHYAHDIIGDFANGAHGYIDWNILLDETGGPNHASNYCYAPLMYNRADHHLEVKPAFSYIGHFSHFIKPGARIMLTSRSNDKVEALGAMNPDGEQVLVLLNTSDSAQKLRIHEGQSTCSFVLPEHSIGTLCWTTQKRDALDDAQPLARPTSRSAAALSSRENDRLKKREKKEAQRNTKRQRKEEEKKNKQREKELDTRNLIEKLAGKAPEPRVIKAPDNSPSLDASLTHVMKPIERKIVPPDPLIDEPEGEQIPVREDTQVINPVKLTPIPNAPKYDLKSMDLNPDATRVMRPIRTTNASTGDSDLESMSSVMREVEQLSAVSWRTKNNQALQSKKTSKSKPSKNQKTSDKKADTKDSKEDLSAKNNTKNNKSLSDLISELFDGEDLPDEPELAVNNKEDEEDLSAEKTTVMSPADVQRVINAGKQSSEIPSPVGADEIKAILERHKAAKVEGNNEKEPSEQEKTDETEERKAQKSVLDEDQKEDSEEKSVSNASSSDEKEEQVKSSPSSNKGNRKSKNKSISKNTSTVSKDASSAKAETGKTKQKDTSKESSKGSSENKSGLSSSEPDKGRVSKEGDKGQKKDQKGSAARKTVRKSSSSARETSNAKDESSSQKTVSTKSAGAKQSHNSSSHSHNSTGEKDKKNSVSEKKENISSKDTGQGKRTKRDVSVSNNSENKPKVNEKNTSPEISKKEETKNNNEHSSNLNKNEEGTTADHSNKEAQSSRKDKGEKSTKSDSSSKHDGASAEPSDNQDEASENQDDVNASDTSDGSSKKSDETDSESNSLDDDSDEQLSGKSPSSDEDSENTTKSLSENEVAQDAMKQASEIAHKSSEAVSKSLHKVSEGWKSFSQKTKDSYKKNKNPRKKPKVRIASKETIATTYNQNNKKH